LFQSYYHFNEPVQDINLKTSILQILNKNTNKVYQNVEIGKRMKMDTIYFADDDPITGKHEKPAGKPMNFSYLILSLLHRFEKLRPWLFFPHQDEAKDTNFSRRRGPNRKKPSELSKLLSSVSLSSGVSLTSHHHPRAHRSKAKLLVPFLCREVAGGRS
jgi:hypothetical protein